MGWLLLFALGMLQMLHFAWLQWMATGAHLAVQRPAVLVAPAFFCLASPLLAPKNERGIPPGAVVARVARVHGGVAAVAPGIAAGLLCWARSTWWLARSLYRLRAQRQATG